MPFMIEAEPRMVANEDPSILEEELADSVLAAHDRLSGVSGLLRRGLSRCFKSSRKLKSLDGKDLSTHSLKGSLSYLREELYQVRFFSFSSVSATTCNFSVSNKLGEGGFGPVYKGSLLNGEQVATKRLSKRSAQGWEEFRNELVVMSKLQHRNIVNLIGCCIEGEENIVVYEYLPNRSLDLFLFDSGVIIDWTSRVRIIQGIAQGVSYLHHYSTLTIIHMDLKPSNILLDQCMNPKISDFGLARIVAGDQEEAQTDRICGTIGYMAPEYFMHGRFSIKSDVFSFGILLLEILSGKKRTSFLHHTDTYVQNHAFELWTGGKPLELKDPNLEETFGDGDSVLFTRYVHIGLLCVQQHPADRPTMSQVVMMLFNQQYGLLPPKLPAFSVLRIPVDPSSHLSKSEGDNCSLNFVTQSIVEAR